MSDEDKVFGHNVGMRMFLPCLEDFGDCTCRVSNNIYWSEEDFSDRDNC